MAGVVLLLVVGGVLALVLLGGDDGDDASSSRDASTTTTGEGPTSEGSSPATDGGSTASEPTVPPSTDAPETTDGVPPTTPSIPSTGDFGTVPEGFPTPPGATEGFVGLDVGGSTAEEVRDFYVAELPGAGYTVGDVIGAAGSYVIPVTGNGVDGQLTVVSAPNVPTTVVWVPN